MAPVTGSCWCKAVKYEFDYEPTEKVLVQTFFFRTMRP